VNEYWKNRSFFKPIKIEEIVIFMIIMDIFAPNGGYCLKTWSDLWSMADVVDEIPSFIHCCRRIDIK